MKTIYKGDTRYEKIAEQMELLSITDVSTSRQVQNGTIVWRLPMKGRGNTHIEYASFATGYVRNQGNQCHSNYQVNKQAPAKPQYFELPNGDYRKYEGKERVLIPIEIDRLEYMMKYVIKNEFIKRASYDSIPRVEHINLMQATEGYYKDKLANAEARADELCKAVVEHGIDNQVKDVQVIVDGTRYKVI